MDESKIMGILTDWNFWGNFGVDLRPRTAYLFNLEKTFGEGAATVLADKKTIEAKDSLIVNFEDPRFPVN
jgi:hypothetical protein